MKATRILKFQARKEKAKTTLEILKEEALIAVFIFFVGGGRCNLMEIVYPHILRYYWKLLVPEQKRATL